MAAVTSCDVMYLEAAADMEMKKNVPHVSSFLRHFNNIGFLRTAKTVTVLNISVHYLISCIFYILSHLIIGNDGASLILHLPLKLVCAVLSNRGQKHMKCYRTYKVLINKH